MDVYFLKSDPKQYVIYPQPENSDDYYIVGVADESELISKSLQLIDGNAVLTDPPPYDDCQYINGEWTLSDERKSLLLAEQQEQMRTAINTLRDEKSKGGIFYETLNKWFDSDNEAQRRINGTIDEMEDEGFDSIMWICADNEIVEVTLADLKAIKRQIFTGERANIENATVHKTAMLAAENPLEYDYSTGWTQTYQDYLATLGD